MSKSPSLRRIQADIRELSLDPSDRYYARPLEHDMFEWHFTIRGADDTDFEGGIYHGRILLPPEYPFKPPHIIFLTPSGRFETNKKICLSFSAYHPELWQPAWGIRLILEALISFLPTPADGAVGALDWSPEERRRLAKLSRNYVCPICGKVEALLPKLDDDQKKKKSANNKTNDRFRKEIEKLQQLQQKFEGGNDKEKEKEGEEDEKNKEKVVDDSKKDAKKEEKKEDSKPSATGTQPMNLERRDATNSMDTIPLDTPSDNEVQAETVGLLDADNRSDGSSRAQAAAAPDDAIILGQEENHHPPAPALQANTNNEAAVLEVESTLSWVYDPLLNLMIVLLAAVCWLLWQKYVDLQEELASLREQNLLLE